MKRSTRPCGSRRGGPFSDKNVRIAMQKAINLEEITDSYYGGDAYRIPHGYVTVAATGQYVPYAEWPEELKWQYEYDPAEAERLLDEAGYPRGADGIRFEAGWDVVPHWGEDLDLALIAKSYWEKIGVDVPIHEVGDEDVFWNNLVAGNINRISHGCCRHAGKRPMPNLQIYFSGEPALFTGFTDPEWNALMDRIGEATEVEEYNQLVREADLYFTNAMWTVALPVTNLYVLHQPWLKGYRGEIGDAFQEFTLPMMSAWVDQELKKEMGH